MGTSLENGHISRVCGGTGNIVPLRSKMRRFSLPNHSPLGSSKRSADERLVLSPPFQRATKREESKQPPLYYHERSSERDSLRRSFFLYPHIGGRAVGYGERSAALCLRAAAGN